MDDKPPIWESFSKALGAEYRPAKEIQGASGLTHEVQAICEHVAVMRHGKLVEYGPTQDVLERPREAYTRELIAAVPNLKSAQPVAKTV